MNKLSPDTTMMGGVRRKIVVGLVLMLVAASSAAFAPHASAAEIFPGHPLRWSILSANGLYRTVSVNTDLLASGSVFRNQASAACGGWQPIPKVNCLMTSFSSSNVDLSAVTGSSWSSWGCTSSTIALTVPTDTAGRQIFNATDAANSTGQIRYAAIYFAPTTDSATSQSAARQTNTIMHEIGHVFGMGHVSDSTSLMYTYQTTITSLSSADRAVIDSFY